MFAGYDLPAIEGEGEMRYHIEALPLLAGTYYLSASICDHSGVCAYDFSSLEHRFRVQPGAIADRYGAMYIPARWEHLPAPETGSAPQTATEPGADSGSTGAPR